MSGTVPWVAAIALELLVMQPRTVWRQVPAAKGSRPIGAKAPRAAHETGPLGGTIDDPLPADFERSGRKLPGPVLKAARPTDGEGPPSDDTLRDVVHSPDPATARLRDVVGPVQRATATKPAKPPRASKPGDSTEKEGGDSGTQGREDS
ncbi:MAG TPA: hypothetical protein VGX78_05380, partial [Pirellulales bacterium]|nr:hypothetical protein [Pirellulales bacterium]